MAKTSNSGLDPEDSTSQSGQQLSCIENWNCTSWGTCLGGKQNRACNDLNSCGTTTNKPVQTQTCTCVESWDCSTWSECIENKQTRTCRDEHECDTSLNKPEISKTCTSTPLTGLDFDAEWNALQEFLSALNAHDLDKINSLSYKPITQEELGVLGDALYSVGSGLKKSDFVNIERDEKQSRIYTNPNAGNSISEVYFVKKNSKFLVLSIVMRDANLDSDKDGRADEDETCTGNIYIHFPDKCIQTDPNKKDSDGDGWWDSTEVGAETNPNSSQSVLF
jgi:hypothetical protein